MKLNKYLLAGGLATALMFTTTAFAQDDDTDDDVEEVEDAETEEVEEDEEVDEDSTDTDEEVEDVEEDLDGADEDVADEDTEVDEDDATETGDSLLPLYRDDLITYLKTKYSTDVEIVATVEGLDWENSSIGLTTKVFGYEIYKITDDSELGDYDPRMFVMFDTEITNDEDVAIEIRNPLQLRFEATYDTALIASDYNMPDNMKHAALLDTEDGVFDPGVSHLPMVVYVNEEQTSYFDENFADLVMSGEYNFSESVPGQDGRRNGQSSHPFMLVEDTADIEEFEFYWDDISNYRFADKEHVNSFQYDDFVVETGYVDMKINGMEMTALSNVDPEQSRNPLEGENHGAITVEIELTNHTDDPISSTSYRNGLEIDGQRNSELLYTLTSFDIYPGETVTVYDTFIVPANQMESYQSIVLDVQQLRDAHNNALVERDEVTFDLLDE